MTDLRAKIERAVYASCKLRVDGDCGRCCECCIENELAFLRALEAEGLKLMDGTPTDAMLVDGGARIRDFYSEGCPYPRTKAMFKAMFAAAPTLADRLKEEK